MRLIISQSQSGILQVNGKFKLFKPSIFPIFPA